MNSNFGNIFKSIENEKNIDNIKLLKEEFNNLIDSHISSLKLCEEIKNINFGNIKSIYENISSKLFSTDKGRKLIHQYINCITENKSLLDLYILYENIKHTSLKRDKSFITESLSLYTFNKKLYNDGISKLRNILKESLNYLYNKEFNLDDILSENDKEINECINYITTNKKTLKTLPIYENKIDRLYSIISENKTSDEINNENNSLTDINENININTITKESIFEEYKNNCINIIDNLLKKSDDTYCKKLTEVKNKLIDKNFNEESIDDDLLHLIELKNTLMKNE